jgi:hypothetical protein
LYQLFWALHFCFCIVGEENVSESTKKMIGAGYTNVGTTSVYFWKRFIITFAAAGFPAARISAWASIIGTMRNGPWSVSTIKKMPMFGGNAQAC